jgi:hypothetical protein
MVKQKIKNVCKLNAELPRSRCKNFQSLCSPRTKERNDTESLKLR